MARLQSHGTVHVRYAKTAEDAAHVYDDLTREFHGTIAYLNFPG